jgi:hypothetical protein
VTNVATGLGVNKLTSQERAVFQAISQNPEPPALGFFVHFLKMGSSYLRTRYITEGLIDDIDKRFVRPIAIVVLIKAIG